jgi:hypothetical protein
VFGEREPERSSIFQDAGYVERQLRQMLPRELASLPLRVDIARHIFRPHTSGPAAGQNFLYDSAQSRVRPLIAHQLYERLPVSHRICRVYVQDGRHAGLLASALDALIGGGAADDLTNM